MIDNGEVQHLSREQIRALKFAAHRQLARWSKKHDLQPRQHAQRSALVRVVQILDDETFAEGCELRATSKR